jgi:hypothetical protein
MLRPPLANSPIHGTDPKTWPWIFYVWIAFLVLGWLSPLWRWFQRTRAADWPIADGRIESASYAKPVFSFTTRRGYYVAELEYSYSAAGTRYTGRYKRQIPTEAEADEFVRDLEGKPVLIHSNPNAPSRSSLLDSDLENVLQNRRPIPESERVPAPSPVPEWITPFLWIFVALSAIGLVASICVNVAAIAGRPVPSLAWVLHVGIFVVWFPAVLVAQRLVGNTNRKDFWKAVTKGAPDWMRYMVYGSFAYSFVGLFLFGEGTFGSSKRVQQPPAQWEGFSATWMVFYSAALAILYSAARIADGSPRCSNGHLLSTTAIYCPRCGQPVTRTQ